MKEEHIRQEVEKSAQVTKPVNQELIDKACKWLYDRVNTPYFTYTDREEIIEDFRKFMEG